MSWLWWFVVGPEDLIDVVHRKSFGSTICQCCHITAGSVIDDALLSKAGADSLQRFGIGSFVSLSTRGSRLVVIPIPPWR
jgi:hypothetical protein